jgi:proteasome beta subunit
MVPMFGPADDPGTSFVSLLKRVGVEPFGSNAGAVQGSIDAPHGTTILALRFADGVVMAGDRQATAGYRIANRDMEKVVAADRHSGVGISGSAGAGMDMIKVFQLQLEHYEKLDGRSISLEGKANQLSQMLRAHMPAAMQGLAVIPIFAGYDLLRGTGRLWSFDVSGGRYEERDFIATGSGGGPASTVLKVGYRPAMSADEAVTLACRALHEAADVDVATAGADSLRGIYPVVATITAEGWVRREDVDLAARFDSFVVEQRSNREGGAS